MKIDYLLPLSFFKQKSQLILSQLSALIKKVLRVSLSIFGAKVNTQMIPKRKNVIKHKKIKKIEKKPTSKPIQNIPAPQEVSKKTSEIHDKEKEKESSNKKIIQSHSSRKSEPLPFEVLNLDSLEPLLKAAMDYSKKICVIGSSNKKADRERTGNFIEKAQKATRFHQNGNRIQTHEIEQMCVSADIREFYEHATRYADLNQDTNLKKLFGRVVQPHESRAGNCGELADIAFYYLWKKDFPEVTRVERVSFDNLDHTFVVVNRSEESSIRDPISWNAWILDPWAEELFHSDEFLPRAREVARQLKAEEEAQEIFNRYDPETVRLDVYVDAEYASKGLKAPDVAFFKVVRNEDQLARDLHKKKFISVLKKIEIL